MPDLYPTFPASPITEKKATQATIRYGKSFFFDFVAGDFVLDGRGRVIPTDGHTAWAHWCVKAVLTERFNFLVYGKGYGVEMEAARKRPGRKATEAEVERTITEALMVDTRTKLVKDFSHQWNGDKLKTAFTVVPRIGLPVEIEVKISAAS